VIILLCAAWRNTSVNRTVGHGAGADDVGQNLPRTDGWQLVDITDDKKRRMIRDGLEQRLHERDIDHGGLVDDQQIALEWIFIIALEAEGLRVELQQAVDGLGLHAGGFGHALGCSSGGGAEEKPCCLG